MMKRRKCYRVLIHLLLLAAYLFTGFFLEFTHNHAIELVSNSNLSQPHFDVERRFHFAKHPCTACRLSRDRLSIEAHTRFDWNIAIVFSTIPQFIFSTSCSTLICIIGSRAPPA
jgi:hypothetical protein